MAALVQHLFALQLLCEWPHMFNLNLVRSASQTLQLVMTIYAAMANPIISPGVIITCSFLVFLFAVLDIILEIIVAIVRRVQVNADLH